MSLTLFWSSLQSHLLSQAKLKYHPKPDLRMIDIQLREDIHERLSSYMKNWEKVTSKISGINDHILQTGNRTVKDKLHYALMH
jgi:hypothetical protein